MASLAAISARALGATLQPIADTHAPSQTAAATRGIVVAELLGAAAGTGLRVTRDLDDTGCGVVRAGTGGVRIVAHLDEISYLVAGDAPDAHGWPLVPFCYHLADGPRDAVIVRSRQDGGIDVAGRGRVEGPPTAVRFAPRTGDTPRPGDRIVLPAPLAIDTDSGVVTGSLDNAAGVAAALVATRTLADLGIGVELVLTDEEEGPSGASTQTIARGAARLRGALPPAPLTVVVDVHGLPPSAAAGHIVPFGASLAEYSSGGRGAVTPPGLFGAIRRLFDDAGSHAQVTTNVGGHVPRSDDVVATLERPTVCLLGYPGSNRHFDHGLPTSNLHDLRSLAQALVVLGASVATATEAAAAPTPTVTTSGAHQ